MANNIFNSNDIDLLEMELSLVNLAPQQNVDVLNARQTRADRDKYNNILRVGNWVGNTKVTSDPTLDQNNIDPLKDYGQIKDILDNTDRNKQHLPCTPMAVILEATGTKESFSPPKSEPRQHDNLPTIYFPPTEKKVPVSCQAQIYDNENIYSLLRDQRAPQNNLDQKVMSGSILSGIPLNFNQGTENQRHEDSRMPRLFRQNAVREPEMTAAHHTNYYTIPSSPGMSDINSENRTFETSMFKDPYHIERTFQNSNFKQIDNRRRNPSSFNDSVNSCTDPRILMNHGCQNAEIAGINNENIYDPGISHVYTKPNINLGELNQQTLKKQYIHSQVSQDEFLSRRHEILEEYSLYSDNEKKKFDLVQEILKTPGLRKNKYKVFDIDGFLKDNTKLLMSDILPRALNILERYAINLFKPIKNRHISWQQINISSTAFEQTLKLVSGVQAILSLLGYEKPLMDSNGTVVGFEFNDCAFCPNIVKKLAADFVIAKYEVENIVKGFQRTHGHVPDDYVLPAGHFQHLSSGAPYGISSSFVVPGLEVNAQGVTQNVCRTQQQVKYPDRTTWVVSGNLSSPSEMKIQGNAYLERQNRHDPCLENTNYPQSPFLLPQTVNIAREGILQQEVRSTVPMIPEAVARTPPSFQSSNISFSGTRQRILRSEIQSRVQPTMNQHIFGSNMQTSFSPTNQFGKLRQGMQPFGYPMPSQDLIVQNQPHDVQSLGNVIQQRHRISQGLPFRRQANESFRFVNPLLCQEVTRRPQRPFINETLPAEQLGTFTLSPTHQLNSTNSASFPSRTIPESPQPQIEQAPEETEEEKTWRCVHCTFINSAAVKVCQMCYKTSWGLNKDPGKKSLPQPVTIQYTQDRTEKQLPYIYQHGIGYVAAPFVPVKEQTASPVDPIKNEYGPSYGNWVGGIKVAPGSHLYPSQMTQVRPILDWHGAPGVQYPERLPNRHEETLPSRTHVSTTPSKPLITSTYASNKISPPDNEGNVQQKRVPAITDEQREKLEQLKKDGKALITKIKEVEEHGYTVEQFTYAYEQDLTDPLEYFSAMWPSILEECIDDFEDTDYKYGRLSKKEAEEAVMSSGKDDVVQRAIKTRMEKTDKVQKDGRYDSKDIYDVLYRCEGDVDKAMEMIEWEKLTPFRERIWSTNENLTSFYSQLQNKDLDFETRIRLVVGERSTVWGSAETGVTLIDAGKYHVEDCIEAAIASDHILNAIRFLEQECTSCFTQVSMNHLTTNLNCQCLMCYDCWKDYFSVTIKEMHIRRLTCPICQLPNFSDETHMANYFNNIGVLIHNFVKHNEMDPGIKELFETKLRDLTLKKDPNFRWCAHCPENGFIWDDPRRIKMVCQHCKKSTCFNCHEKWLPQHEGISCDDFKEWKEANDTEYLEAQAADLASQLARHGIRCPECNFMYDLARGGCLHFRCLQCGYEFCSGCSCAFRNGAQCQVHDSCKLVGLHAHHPRNCLYYMRDMTTEEIKELLRHYEIEYNTEESEKEDEEQLCHVMEQNETENGMKDEECGAAAPAGNSGLCEKHYKEYLVKLCNDHGADPLVLMDENATKTVLKRAFLEGPSKEKEDTDDTYLARLKEYVKSELPLPGIPQPHMKQQKIIKENPEISSEEDEVV